MQGLSPSGYPERPHRRDVALLQKELIPVRDERKYPRLQTAHFRSHGILSIAQHKSGSSINIHNTFYEADVNLLFFMQLFFSTADTE